MKSALAIIFTFFIYVGHSSEVDQSTYADIELADSSEIINIQLKKILDSIRVQVNTKILLEKAKNKILTDTDKEFLFFELFHDTYMGKSLIWSPFEDCIRFNLCPGWDFIERIIVNQDENIYTVSGYSKIAGKYSAGVINLCGIRMGADKLTHMFLDGLIYYNCSKDIKANFTKKDIRDGSEAVENSLMGLGLTGVHSPADVEANLKGVDFYQDLFSGKKSFFQKDENGLLRWRKKINICSYVSINFDETFSKNKYINIPRLFSNNEIHQAAHQLRLSLWEKKLKKLEDMIKRRNDESRYRIECLSDEEKAALKKRILLRIPKSNQVSKFDGLIFTIKGIIDWMFQSSVRKGYKPYLFKC